MLRTSFKSSKLFQTKRKKKIEFATNIFKIATVWFRNEFNFRSLNLPFMIVRAATRFIKGLIMGVFNFLSQDAKRLLTYYRVTDETKQFTKAIINFNRMLLINNSEILMDFYKTFLQFYWLINPQILRKNTIRKFDVDEHLFFNIYPKVMSYMNNESQNFINKSTKIKTICFISGRGRSVLRAFKLSRFKFRELINQGMFLGITKSSW